MRSGLAYGRSVSAVALSFEGGLLLVAVVASWLLDASLLKQISIRWWDVGMSLAGTCPLVLGLVWGDHCRWSAVARLFQKTRAQIVPLFAGLSVVELALISAVAGVAEESLFRGVIQTALTDSIGPLPALVVASALFGLAHLITPMYALLASVIGLYLGLLLLVSDNLLTPILVHGLYDFVALLYLLRTGSWLRRSVIKTES